MARNWPLAVVFDLDGTLVDSAPDIAVAINAAFAPLGAPAFPVATVRGFVGGGAVVAVERAAKAAGLALDGEAKAAALGRFYAALEEASRHGQGLYPGARGLLDGLRARRVRLALATNKAEPITHVALAALGIAGYFESVVGLVDGGPRKPDPAMLLKALAPLGVSPADAVMIGDSHADVEAAKAAGMRVIAMSYGYSWTPVVELGADLVLDRLADVPAALGQLAAG